MQNNRTRDDDTVISVRPAPIAGRRRVATGRLPSLSRAWLLGRHRTAAGQWYGAPTLWRCRAGGDVTIVEIKSCLLDYQTDGKWQDYLDFCDRLYFAVNADFPCEIIPVEAGLILADRYGAELVREPAEERLSAARRKAMMLCFARAAALRLQLHLGPVLRLRGSRLISGRAWRECAGGCGDAC